MKKITKIRFFTPILGSISGTSNFLARTCFQTVKKTVLVFIVSTLSICVYAQDDGLTFSVSGFEINGPNPISESRTDRILEPYLNRSVTIETLREAVTELEKVMALEGFNFYRAGLPPQTLNSGLVKIEIQNIEIDNVFVTGNEFFSDGNLQRSLPLVRAGNSPNTQQIANALLLAEDNPAKDIRVVFVKGAEPQTVDANISVQDQNPNELFFWLNNAGSALTTDSRLGMQYHNRNLWDRDHQIALSYTVSPEDTNELNQYGINYRLPVYLTRGMVNLFYSKSDADTGVVGDNFELSGAGQYWGIGYTHYMDKKDDYQHRLGVNVTDKEFDSDIFFIGTDTDIGLPIRSRPLTIEYTSRFDRSNWLVNSVLSYSSNLSSGDFNNDESYEIARSGAKADWSKAELAFRYDYRWNQQWRGSAFVFAQSTSDPLISGEQFGLGGALGDPGPRGFYEREVSVDKGIKGTVQVNREIPTKGMQIGFFYDYATGDLINPQAGENADETLSSVGISYKWNIRSNLSLDVDYGYVVDGVDQTLNSTATDDGDSRLHVTLRYFPLWPFGGSK